MAAEHRSVDEHAHVALTKLLGLLRRQPQDVVVHRAEAKTVYMSVTQQEKNTSTFSVFHCEVHGDGLKYKVVIDIGGHGAGCVDVYSPVFDSEFEGRSPFHVPELLRDVPHREPFQVLLQRVLVDLGTVFFMSIAHERGELNMPNNDVVWPWQ